MVKLSTLVGSRETLKEKSTTDLSNDVNSVLTKLNADLSKIDVESTEYIASLEKSKEQALLALKEYEDTLNAFKVHLDQNIDQMGPVYYQKSEQVYNESRNEGATYVADRFLFSSYLKYDFVEQEFKNRIELYASWAHPGLFIRPEKGELVDAMISNDPLYIVDEDKELLLMTQERWTKEYQSRLRYGLISDDRVPHIVNLPEEQLGLIVVFHFFNYKPLNLIKEYLQECYTLLKPGGTLIFTFNNCDLPDAVKQVEHAYNTYTPKSTLLAILEGLGFEVLAEFDRNPNVSWLEVKKPGTLSSLRGGQALAQIKDSRLDN